MKRVIWIGLFAAFIPGAYAQTEKPAAQPDVLILTDGEKLIGQFEKATDTAITFKSTVLGEVSVNWEKVQEIQSSQKFALIPKNVTLRGAKDASSVPVGTISIRDQKVQVTTQQGAEQQPVPVSDVGRVVDQADFEKALQPSGFLQGWSGGATGGIALTESTQKNQSFTGAINLVRSTPEASWLDTRTRTLINFNSAYSKLTQPATPAVKTSLIHFSAEQDWYLSPRLFAFATGALDHSFSQGLKLQQNYGGGLGLVVLKDSAQELDVKASLDYIDQRFETGSSMQLVGSDFSETYTRKFAHGILLNEGADFTPSWNNTTAYTMTGTAGLTFPVYHRFGLTISTLDTYLNDPPPGFLKNSYQLTVGATYSIR